MVRWTVQLLGTLRILCGEQVVTRFRTRSADVVFAYLSLHLGQDVRREKLEEIGWPDSEQLKRKQNLRTALTSIRTTLGHEVLDADRGVVRLNPDYFDVDALRFRESKDISLYKGRLLDGVTCERLLPFQYEFEDIYVRAIGELMDQLPLNEALKLGMEALRRDPSCVGLRAKVRDLDQIGYSARLRASPFLVSAFIGREREVSELSWLLERNRLITLTGMGGIGKTRLAAEIWSRNMPDAWFISLAELRDARYIGETIGQGLRLPLSSVSKGLEQVIKTLRDESGLLVLDNFEHILSAKGAVEEILLNCPQLRILATSRVGLDIPNEIEFQVGPMATATGAVKDLSESAQFFQDRARATEPSFSITAANEQAVEELCTHLDGFPLSLEVAAAKSRIYSPEEMVRQLGDRFEFLTSSEGGRKRRHSSLLDALDWSFDRLSEADQTLLCQLSVFEGGFTLDAAKNVCGATNSDARLEKLLTSAWIQRTHSSGPTRFRILESIRDYGASLLKPHDQKERQRTHALYYLDMCVRCQAASFTPEEPTFHRLVGDDISNIETAYQWLCLNEPEEALTMVGALNWYWIVSGLAHVGEQRIKDAILKVDETPRQNLGRAYHHAGNFLLFQGRFAESEDWFRRAFNVCSQVDDTFFRGLAASQWGRVLAEMGKDKEATLHIDESIRCLLQIGDDNWICAALTIRSLVGNRAGDVDLALEAGRLGVEHGRKGGYRWGLASCLNELAMACHLSGDYATSVSVQTESISLKRELNALPALVISLADLSATYVAMGDLDKAKETLRDCASALWRLNDHEYYPKVFATAAELFWESGHQELAIQSLAKMVALTNNRRVSASETEARNRAMRLVDKPLNKTLIILTSSAIVDALSGL